MPKRDAERGHTLLELLLVLALLGAIHAWVMPEVVELVQSLRLHSGAEALTQSLLRARSEAVSRNGRVVVCKSSTGASCDPGARWDNGWIVFHDLNNNAELDPGEQLVLREPALPPAVRLSGNLPVRTYVSYTPFGQAKLTSGAFQAGTFTACLVQGRRAIARQIAISSGGRPRSAKVTLERCP